MTYFVASTRDHRTVITLKELDSEDSECFKDFESLESIGLSSYVELGAGESRRGGSLDLGRLA